MRKLHDIRGIAMDERYLTLRVGARRYRIEWAQCSRRLAEASPEQRRYYDVSPGGYGIHWPEIDEDLAIGPLLAQAADVTDEAPNATQTKTDNVVAATGLRRRESG